MKEKIREILWNFVAGEVTDSEAVQQVLDLFGVTGSVFLVFNPNGHVIAAYSNYEKAEEIFRSLFGEFDPSVGIEEIMVDVKHCH